jgi:hypothetical protein
MAFHTVRAASLGRLRAQEAPLAACETVHFGVGHRDRSTVECGHVHVGHVLSSFNGPRAKKSATCKLNRRAPQCCESNAPILPSKRAGASPSRRGKGVELTDEWCSLPSPAAPGTRLEYRRGVPGFERAQGGGVMLVRTLLIVIVAAMSVVCRPRGLAAAQAPTHKHYETPPDGKAELGKPLAPRLQNLGVRLQGDDPNARARAVVRQPGVNPARLQPCRGRARASPRRRGSTRRAMAYWGSALVIGPNINAPMNPDDEPRALEFIQKAIALKARVTPRERDYIDALAKRHGQGG